MTAHSVEAAVLLIVIAAHIIVWVELVSQASVVPPVVEVALLIVTAAMTIVLMAHVVLMVEAAQVKAAVPLIAIAAQEIAQAAHVVFHVTKMVQVVLMIWNVAVETAAMELVVEDGLQRQIQIVNKLFNTNCIEPLNWWLNHFTQL